LSLELREGVEQTLIDCSFDAAPNLFLDGRHLVEFLDQKGLGLVPQGNSTIASTRSTSNR
jgi:hypothetical protein